MILAIDTASKTGTVAIVDDTGILAECSIVSEKTHSVAVLPMIDSMFKLAGRKIEDIDSIACTTGPGSFTGIRVGAAIAKGIAFSLDKKIVPVSTLDMLAYNVLIEGYTICPVIDARRGHVYTAFYNWSAAGFERLSDYMTIPAALAIEKGTGFGRPVYFIGSGLAYVNKLEITDRGVVLAYDGINIHRAGVLGIYARDNRDKLQAVKSNELTLIYMSRSQAEEDNDRSS